MAKAVSARASQPEAATRPPARFITRGHNAAASRVAQLITGVPPHALLIVGPCGAGAGTLARDVAATLLCATPQSDGACGECRACRLVVAESHADLARITPSGAADEIGITPIRELETSLALLPVEGGRRVALIEHAERMSEPAQNALLKTLEEPPYRRTSYSSPRRTPRSCQPSAVVAPSFDSASQRQPPQADSSPHDSALTP